MKRQVIFAMGLLSATALAYADSFYRCAGADGRPVFSDKPCGQGANVQKIRVRPNVISSEGLRDWADRTGEGRGAAEASRPETAVAPAEEAPAVDSLACENARRDYEFVAGYRRASASEIAQKRRVYDDRCGRGSEATGSE